MHMRAIRFISCLICTNILSSCSTCIRNSSNAISIACSNRAIGFDILHTEAKITDPKTITDVKTLIAKSSPGTGRIADLIPSVFLLEFGEGKHLLSAYQLDFDVITPIEVRRQILGWYVVDQKHTHGRKRALSSNVPGLYDALLNGARATGHFGSGIAWRLQMSNFKRSSNSCSHTAGNSSKFSGG